MKRNITFILISIIILILGACGQGADPKEPEQIPDEIEIETEENDELIDENQVDESNEEENEDEQGEEANEQPITSDDIDKNEMTIELVFADDQVMDMYRVERQIEGSDEDAYLAAFHEWIEGPKESDLVSLLPEGVEVLSIEEKDGVAHVSFSEEFLNAQVGSGPEAMLLQQVAMIMKQFGFNETQILIEGEIQPELFGHIDTSVPIVADDLDNYEKRN